MMYKKVSLALLLLSSLLVSCQKDVLPVEDVKQPMFSGGDTQYNYTTNGFDMHVVVNSQGMANVTTAVSAVPARDGDPYLVNGPGSDGVGFGESTFEAPSSSGEPTVYTQLDFPVGPSTPTYWAVPFEPGRPPVKVQEAAAAMPIIIIGQSGCLCTGSPGGTACVDMGQGCVTGVCITCGRDIIIIIIGLMAHPAETEPYAIVGASSLMHNGILYQ